MLRGANAVGTPGIILEHSFHTNTRATKWLSSDSNLQKLAKAEEAYAAMRRSTNGGGENSPMLEGEDDLYELFFAGL